MFVSREEEVWRLPHTAKGQDVRLGTGDGSHRPPSLSPAAKARLGRIVSKAPEAMVKLTGRTRGGDGHLKAHLDYLTRNGRLEAENQNGEPVSNRDQLRALNDDWLLANALNARGRNTAAGAQSVGIILSMPPGTPRDRVEAAARTWARETFNGTHDWLMVRHNDRDHPHVHVSVRAVGYDGRRLAPGPADLQQWRERFARELRRLGVEAEATPRQARGIVRKSSLSAIHRSEERGVEPRVRRAERQEADREARGPQLAPARDWQRDVQARQEAIRAAYLGHAATLAEGDADDRRLARNIQRFVADMPVPLNRRQALAVELRRVLDQRPGRAFPGATGAPSDLHSANPARPPEPVRTPVEPARDRPEPGPTRRR